MIDRLHLSTGYSPSQLLKDKYRSPEDLVDFEISEGATDEGYFRFGESAVCFGQLRNGQTRSTAEEPLHDALREVIVDDWKVSIPFNPAQVVNNLLSERYRKGNGFKSWPGGELIRRSYYALRPMMPVGVRKYLQKVYFIGWQQIPFPCWPVDATVEKIEETLLLLALKARRGKPIPFIWFWPDGIPSCAVLTHDVETQAGVDFCSELMDINDSFGVKSSFQMIPEGRYTAGSEVVDRIRRRGFELNIHDLNHDGHLFRDRTEFLRRAARINEYVRSFGAAGFRSAVMYRNADWLEALEVMYDMSFPNVSHLEPQRGGCCTVRPFFIGRILELPVTMTQDYTLFHILGQYSTQIWLEQSRLIREKHGLISALVHPDYLNSQRAIEVYRQLLKHFCDLRTTGQTWIALPREVAVWWRQRSLMKLVADGTSWRIEGEGSGRARLAYAVLDGDSISYEIVRSGDGGGCATERLVVHPGFESREVL